MNKRGFTLIELLAVIVVISVIALISVPLVNMQIERSKMETIRESVKGMVKAIIYYQTENEIYTGGEYTVNNENLMLGSKKLEVDGAIIGTGTITMDTKDKATVKIQYQGYCATGDSDNLKIEKKACSTSPSPSPTVTGTPTVTPTPTGSAPPSYNPMDDSREGAPIAKIVTQLTESYNPTPVIVNNCPTDVYYRLNTWVEIQTSPYGQFIKNAYICHQIGTAWYYCQYAVCG